MDQLPQHDIPMLVSTINFLLRDEVFENLEEICNHFNVNREELEKKLASQDFHYDETKKRVW